MKNANHPQPEILSVSDAVRLRKYDGNYQIAVKWYQDPVVYYNSEGIVRQEDIPDEGYVKSMYDYLSEAGECYFIEVLEDGRFIPVGDVTIKAENPPIVIGEARYRGRGLGKQVMAAVLKRAMELGIPKIYGSAVYDYNIPSQRLHEALGFRPVGKKENMILYERCLQKDGQRFTEREEHHA